MNKNLNTVIEISGYKFIEIYRIQFKQTLNQRSHFEFDLNLDEPNSNSNFLRADYREEIKYEGPQGLRFRGYIVSVKPLKNESNIISVKCTDQIGLMKDQQFNNFKVAGKSHHADLMAFVLNLSNINYNIELPTYHTEGRFFKVILPLKQFNLSRNLNLGKCKVLTTLPNISIIKDNETFQKYATSIEIIVSGNSIYNALESGLFQINTAVSILNYGNKIPGLITEYHLSNQRSRVSIGELVYIEDLKYQTQIVMSYPLSFIIDDQYSILDENYFSLVNKLTNRLVNEDYLSNKEKQKEIWVLYYLMKAENSTNIREGFLLLWLSLEFLISRFYDIQDSKFSKEETKEFRKYILNYSKFKEEDLDSLVETGKLSHMEKQTKKKQYENIEKNAINIINNNMVKPSLFEKLNYLLVKYGLELNEKEKIIYKNAREVRNKIIHGTEDVEPIFNDYNIISKIVYFIIYQALL